MISKNGNQIRHARGTIAGVVSAIPASRYTNDDLGPDAHEAAKMTGVLERRHAQAPVGTEDLCRAAAHRLMQQLRWPPDSIDTLIFVTQTPSLAVPSSGYVLHEQLCLPKSCAVLEVNWSCAGYVYGLWLALSLAQPGRRTLLLVGDVTSQIADPGDRATWPLFGDAGSATAIEGGGEDAQQHTFFMGSEGRGASKLMRPHGGFLRMDGAEVFAFTLRAVPGLVEDVLGAGEPEVILLHQANAYMLDHLEKKMRLYPRFRPQQVPRNIERFGNCSSASIPLLLCDAMCSEGPARFMRLACIGYGAGLSWCGGSVLFSSTAPREVIGL